LCVFAPFPLVAGRTRPTIWTIGKRLDLPRDPPVDLSANAVGRHRDSSTASQRRPSRWKATRKPRTYALTDYPTERAEVDAVAMKQRRNQNLAAAAKTVVSEGLSFTEKHRLEPPKVIAP
jgi:hypothetical protein